MKTKAIACHVIVGSMTLALASRAHAVPAASADDVCPPATDPCVISQSYEVTGPLDFGHRTVQVVNGGRLKGQPDLTLWCGALEVTTGLTANPVIEVDGNDGGDLSVTVVRACSGDGTTPCLDDTVCTGASLGTCSAGNSGTIDADGKMAGNGGDPRGATIRAAGDIVLGRLINFSSTAAGYDGGSIDVESYMGSVTATGQLSAKSGLGTYDYSAGLGGDVDVRAAVDVDVSGGIEVRGAGGGGSVVVDAGRDVIVTSGISGSGGGGLGANGGRVSLYAGRDLIVVQIPGGDAVQEIQADGGTSFYFYGYGGGGDWYSGYGGYQYFNAGEDISLARSAKVHADGGWAASGGNIYFDAGGELTIEGEVRSIGPPPEQGLDSGAAGGWVSIVAGAGMTLAQGAVIRTASPVRGGDVTIEVDGPVTLDGTIDARGTGTGPYNYSQPGYFTLEGVADVTVGGKIRTGGPYRDGLFEIDVCRLALTSTGELDNSHGSPNPQAGDIDITVRESMTAANKSKILADPAGGRNLITYRDPNKPPVLEGTVTPEPKLSVNPSLVGCPVCGNLEIDQGESCDDANTASGDGCRDDCQDEGCIAQTPGYPSTALCDDGNACTLNVCDPQAHDCLNPISCEEGVACTVDACVGGACEHTPSDALCDDHNDCTDDICNGATGCVYANLTGGSCEDADFCTPTGTCDDGDCLAGAVRLATDSNLKIKVKPAAADDILKAKTYLPVTFFSAEPTATGATVVVADELGAVLFQQDLPGAGWLDKKGTGERFSYKDALRSAKIKRRVGDETARAVVKIKGADLGGALGQSAVGVSILFGTDPATDDCLTAREVPCTTKGTTVSCR